jgi:hypothetical protein
MSMVKGCEGTPPNPELMAAIGALAQEMARTGALVEMGGLRPSASGARMRLTRGKVTVTDGPFTESKELIGGFAIFEVGSKQEMLELAGRFMQLHADIMGDDHVLELEIREMDEG